jgi:hypothetical protein
VSGTNTTFDVYPNGTVTDEDTGKNVCATGGETCLDSYIDDKTK